MRVTLEDVSEIVCVQLGVERVNSSDHLVESLGADSADLLNIILAVEDRYGIAISEEHLAALETVGDLYNRAVELALR